MVDGPILLLILWPKTAVHSACHDLVHCCNASWNRQTKVEVLSDDMSHKTSPEFHMTTLGLFSTLFKKLKVDSALVIIIIKKDNIVFTLVHDVCLFGLSDAEVF
jgi:hypothetical protein